MRPRGPERPGLFFGSRRDGPEAIPESPFSVHHRVHPQGSPKVWTCNGLKATSLWGLPQTVQPTDPDRPDQVATYWMWRFDRTDDPVPLDNFWGKTQEEALADLVEAANPFIGSPAGPAQVELAVDPYFPSTIGFLPDGIRGRAVHLNGRNRLFLDGHVDSRRDARTE